MGEGVKEEVVTVLEHVVPAVPCAAIDKLAGALANAQAQCRNSP